MVELQDERLSIGKGQTINQIKSSLFAVMRGKTERKLKRQNLVALNQFASDDAFIIWA